MTTPFGKSRKLLEVVDDAELDDAQAQAFLWSPALGALLRAAKNGTLPALEAAPCVAGPLLEGLELVVEAAIDSALLPANYRDWAISSGEDDRVDNPSGAQKLSLVEFFKPGDDGRVVGEEMRRRALEGGVCAGESVGVALLKNQRAIPKSWRKYVLVLAGSLRQDALGDRFVLYFAWDGKCWFTDYRWLDHDFRGCYRVVRCS